MKKIKILLLTVLASLLSVFAVGARSPDASQTILSTAPEAAFASISGETKGDFARVGIKVIARQTCALPPDTGNNPQAFMDYTTKADYPAAIKASRYKPPSDFFTGFFNPPRGKI